MGSSEQCRLEENKKLIEDAVFHISDMHLARTVKMGLDRKR